MSSLSEIKVYRNEEDPIWLAEAKWYDNNRWYPLISSAFKDFGVDKLFLYQKKSHKAVPLADPIVLKKLGVQHISCNTGSTELLPYHVVVFKAAHVYYGDVLEIPDPRGFIQMAFLISVEGTKKYPTLTADMVEMMSNLRKYALIPFLTPLSELVFPPMSSRVYKYSDLASTKEFGTAMQLIKKEYPEVFSAIALINHISVNGVDSREAYPRVLMYDKNLEHLINSVAEGVKGFEILEFSPHFRRRGAPRQSLNTEKPPSSPPRRKMVNAKYDQSNTYAENSEKEQGGPSIKKQKNLGERTEASDINGNFNIELEEKVKRQGSLVSLLEKKITDQAKLIDELSLKLEKHDDVIMMMQAQTSLKDYRKDNTAICNRKFSTAAFKKNKLPLEADDDDSDSSTDGD